MSDLPGTLSYQQIAFFRSAGYLRLDKHLPDPVIDGCLAEIRRICETDDPTVNRAESGLVMHVPQLVQRHPVFMEAFTQPFLLDALESLLGNHIEFTKFRHNHATINAKKMIPVRLHRDVLQWTRNIVSALIYLEDAPFESGCTMVIPTTQGLPCLGTSRAGGIWMDEYAVYDDLVAQAVPVPMVRGSVLLIDSLIFHTVGPNTTDRTRISLTGAYHSVDELSREQGDSRILVRGERIYRGNDKDRERTYKETDRVRRS